jgi:chromosome segregation ATPase
VSATTPADQRLRAAIAALAEHDHLRQGRDLLAQDVQTADHRVKLLSAELAREQRDVHDLSTGVMGFLASLAMTGELEREKREAMEAGIRLREGQAAHEGLRAQLAALDARLASPPRSTLEAEVTAARGAKEALMRQLGAPGGSALIDIGVRIESIDIELVPLEDAVAAGTAAAATLFEVLDVLDRQGAAPAKGLVGDAQARVTLFHRAVDQLGVPDDTQPPFANAISDDDRTAWVDPWLKRLFGSGDRETRLGEARTELLTRLTRLRSQLEPVRARRDELAARRSNLASQYDHLLDPG